MLDSSSAGKARFIRRISVGLNAIQTIDIGISPKAYVHHILAADFHHASCIFKKDFIFPTIYIQLSS